MAGDVWMIRIMVVLAMFAGAMVYFMFVKRRYQMQAKSSLLCLFRNRAGRWRWELFKIIDGMVELPPKKQGDSGKTFTVDSESAPDIDYPVNKWSFLQTTIPCAVFNEENFDPLSNVSGRPVLSPRLLNVIRNEGWSGLGVRYSMEAEKKEKEADVGGKKKGFNMTNVLWIVVVIALVVLAIWGFDQIKELRAASGI